MPGVNQLIDMPLGSAPVGTHLAAVECNGADLFSMDALQLVSGQAVGTLFDLEESQYMQERMEAERQNQGTHPCLSCSRVCLELC